MGELVFHLGDVAGVSFYTQNHDLSKAILGWESSSKDAGNVKGMFRDPQGHGTNPFEKYARQNGNLPQVGLKIKDS